MQLRQTETKTEENQNNWERWDNHDYENDSIHQKNYNKWDNQDNKDSWDNQDNREN